ncbi:hypothetical protein JCM8208_006325 [Rhodotorula glutinis]
MAATASAPSPVLPVAHQPSSSVADLLDSILPSTTLKRTLDQHAQALLACRIQRNTRRQVDHLRGELRDDFASRAWAVKADWMARVVPERRDEGQDSHERTGDNEPSAGDEQNADIPPSSPTSTRPTASLPPTILSDTDGAAHMARRVDGTVEDVLAAQVDEARGRIEASVRRSEVMELELWLGQEILDALSTAAGDEAQAAQLVLERLEDVCVEEHVALM